MQRPAHSLYEQALELDQAGDGEAALRQLGVAVEQGHHEAQLQLAIWLLVGRNCQARPTLAMRLFAQLADAGDPYADAVLASLAASGYGMAQSWTVALDRLLRAAQGGLARAMTQLALLLPPTDFARQLLLLAAAQAGDAPAKLLCPQTVDVPWSAMEEARFWARIRRRARFPHHIEIPTTDRLHDKPSVAVIRGLLPLDLCRYLGATARPWLKPATVNDATDGERPDASRSNRVMSFFPLERDVLVQSIDQRLAAAAQLPLSYGDVLSVLHYRPGETYRPHFDFFDPAFPQHAVQLADRGQRVLTMLVYLNDEYRDGHTQFQRLNWSFRGQPGDALMFSNVDADGEPDRMTLHSGASPTAGEKWLLSKWFRNRVQPH